MSSRKQGTAIRACKDSSLKQGNKQLYASIRLQRATRQDQHKAKAASCLTALQHIRREPAGFRAATSSSGQATKPREGQEGSRTGRQGIGLQTQFTGVRILAGG